MPLDSLIKQVQAGELNRQVTLQSQDTASGTYGERKESWTSVATVWAAVDPLSGSEGQLGDAAEAAAMSRVTIRYRAGVLPDQQVIYAGRTLRIVSVSDTVARHRLLELLCAEIPGR